MLGKVSGAKEPIIHFKESSSAPKNKGALTSDAHSFSKLHCYLKKLVLAKKRKKKKGRRGGEILFILSNTALKMMLVTSKFKYLIMC